MYKYVIGSLLLILVYSVILARMIREDFMVEGPPMDIKVRKDSSKAYYNEMSNAEFEGLLAKSFPYPCYRLSIASDESKWREAPRDDDDDKAKKILKYVIGKINDNRDFDDPNLSTSPEFQMVDYSVVNKWQNHLQPWFYKYEIKAVVYREGKYHGKQILFTALLRGSIIDIVQISVEGIVFEDRIALYPVSGLDRRDIEQSDPADYQNIIFENEAAQEIIDAHAASAALTS